MIILKRRTEAKKLKGGKFHTHSENTSVAQDQNTPKTLEAYFLYRKPQKPKITKKPCFENCFRYFFQSFRFTHKMHSAENVVTYASKTMLFPLKDEETREGVYVCNKK